MSKHPKSRNRDAGVVVVGSGMAGLVCALSIAPRPVTLITKTPGLDSGSSLWAKGGIAAAVGPGDTPEEHASDTLSAGAGLSDERRALDLARQGAGSLQLLIDKGVPFDRAVDGTLALAREAAHGRPRVVHAGGDATGRMMTAALIDRVRATPSIVVLENTFAWDLLVWSAGIRGCEWLAHSRSRQRGPRHRWYRDGLAVHDKPPRVDRRRTRHGRTSRRGTDRPRVRAISPDGDGSR
jgi:aspartate oxidase